MLQNEEVCGNTIYSSSEARVENMVLPCTSELCNYISYQVEMVRYSHNVLSYGVLMTRFLRKQWHVTSHVFEVA